MEETIVSKVLILGVIILTLCLVGSASAEPDSLWIGEMNAYYVGNSVFKVPLYYSNDQPFNSLGFPFLFVSSGDPIIPDSVTRAGRSYGMNIFDLFLGFTSGDYGGNPDSTCVGLISFTGEIPPGDGIIADFWFSGGQVGDLISFVPIEYYPPGCVIGPDGPEGPPVHVLTNLLIGPGGTEIVCQTSVSIQATRPVTLSIGVIGTASPFDLEILSFDGPAYDNEPTLLGNDPWTFTWVPGFTNLGDFSLVLRATDADEATVDKTVSITVTELEVDPCDVARGDLNCDGIVDIADLVFMVDWMFSGGPAPYCK